MVEFMVMVKKPDGIVQGLGSHKFRSAPQIGHYVTLDDENRKGQAYEVISVMHPMDPAPTAGDLILRYIGTDIEVRKALKS